jgi:hypothetical protein
MHFQPKVLASFEISVLFCVVKGEYYNCHEPSICSRLAKTKGGYFAAARASKV